MASIDNTQIIPSYAPDPVERLGRRLKMEYVGMASVFTFIGLFIFRGVTPWYHAAAAMLGTYGLFMGIKKKTRDHFSASWLLFAAAVVARGGLLELPRWALPYLLFGACVYLLEAYVDKHRSHFYALPAVLGVWAAVDLSWVLGLVFGAAYLGHVSTERPRLRGRLAGVLALSAVVGIAASAVRLGALVPAWSAWAQTRLTLGSLETALLLAMGIPTLLALVGYWRNLRISHKINTVIFGLLAPWDERLLALFGMVAVVLLTATVFRQSIDSDRLRPFFKHAEWYFFWFVLALAIWAAFHA